MGNPQSARVITVMWTGAHYDTVRLLADDLVALQQHLAERHKPGH